MIKIRIKQEIWTSKWYSKRGFNIHYQEKYPEKTRDVQTYKIMIQRLMPWKRAHGKTNPSCGINGY